MQDLWTRVDEYFGARLVAGDDALEGALAANRKAGLPPIDVTPLQGKFLDLLVRISGAQRVLEIGTLGGYSTIWLARALPDGGRIVSLESSAHHADVARENLRNAGVMDCVDLRVGRAIDTLPALVDDAPFDLIFIDADKQSLADYLEWAMKLSRAGTVIVADNVVREGKVLDAENDDPGIEGVRRFTEQLAAEPRLSATVLQTVGMKGYDGFAIAVVVS
jgi:predicted O-methyltransferase YrrM